MQETKEVPKSVWQKVGSIEERAVVQLQFVRSQTLRPLWSSPSVSLNKRNEGDKVVLDSYVPALAFVSVPMLSKGHRMLQEEKLVAGLSAELDATSNAAHDGTQASTKTAEKKEEGKTAEKETKLSSGEPTTKPKVQLITEVDELD